MTAGIKIWGVVPVLTLFGWLIFSSGIRRAAVYLVGAAIGCTLVCLPFFVLAPSQMWRMVVVDQVQRNNGGLRSIERMNQILGLTLYNPPPRLTVALVVVVLLMVAATIVAWTQWRVRPVVLLMLGLGAMLMVTPSWFLHYTALTAGPIAITIGAAGQQAVSWAGARGWRAVQLGVAGALLLGLLAASAPIAPARVGQRFPGRTLAAAMAPRPGCITTDNASTLILTNTLSRNLDRGCQLVADLGGASYHLDSPARGVLSRQKNAVFQQYALAYLRTGQTTILVRFRRGFGLSSGSYDIVQRWPVVARAGQYVLRAPQP
jgi:alpha-1,2-mannosyltransferase